MINTLDFPEEFEAPDNGFIVYRIHGDLNHLIFINGLLFLLDLVELT